MIKRVAKYFLSKFGLELNRKQSAASEKDLELYAIVGSNSNVEEVYLDVRNPEDGRKYFEVGNDSIVTGSFIFENANGKIKIGSRTFIGGGMFLTRAPK